MEYVIDGRGALARLASDRTLKTRLRRIRIELAGGSLAEWERQLNRHYFACGCETGSVAVVAVLLAGSTAWAAGLAPGLWRWWSAPAGLALAAILGKLAGLGVSRMKVRRLLRALASYCEEKRL